MAYFTKGIKGVPDIHIWDELLTHTDGLGGGVLDVTEIDASMNKGYLDKGCPLFLDLDTKKAHVVKSALVIAGGTTTKPRVSKKSLFKVGDFAYVSGDAVTVLSIDRSNTDYDIITMSAACVGATANAIILEAKAAGATPEKKYEANCLLMDQTIIRMGETVGCIFRIDQWCENKRFSYALSAATITALAPNIIIK